MPLRVAPLTAELFAHRSAAFGDHDSTMLREERVRHGRRVRATDPPQLFVHADGTELVMASYSLNPRAVAHARRLVAAHHYVLDSDWSKVQPSADDENTFLESHSWEDYAEWHLGLTAGANDDTKARYGFVYGDFRRVHRMGLIACQYRAAEFSHKEIELAAHDLLQLLDKVRG